MNTVVNHAAPVTADGTRTCCSSNNDLFRISIRPTETPGFYCCALDRIGRSLQAAVFLAVLAKGDATYLSAQQPSCRVWRILLERLQRRIFSNTSAVHTRAKVFLIVVNRYAKVQTINESTGPRDRDAAGYPKRCPRVPSPLSTGSTPRTPQLFRYGIAILPSACIPRRYMVLG